MLRESHRPGIEPATCKSQVQRPTAEPPAHHATHCALALVSLHVDDVNGLRKQSGNWATLLGQGRAPPHVLSEQDPHLD